MIEPTQRLQEIFDNAVNVAKNNSHEYNTIEHILYSIYCDDKSKEIISDD